MKITKSIIRDMTIFMIGFGVLIGIIFPFFSLLFGIDKTIALSHLFFASCILAGILVGSVNIMIVRYTLVGRLKTMTDKMEKIRFNLKMAAQGKEFQKCDVSTCQIKIESDDEIGRSASTYNDLVEILSLSMSGEELISKLDEPSIVELSLPQMLKVSDSYAGCILKEKEGEMVVVSSFGFKNIEQLLRNKHVVTVAAGGKTVKISYPEDIVIDGILLDIIPKEVIVEPLAFGGINVGVVVLAAMHTYEESVLDKLGILIKNLSLAFHNATIHEQLQVLAAIDPVTGIYNRRFGLGRLKEEYERSVRNDEPIGILMLDIDHFKKINDTYGHLAGDKVLSTIAKTVKANLRSSDIILRYGGEEFIIVFPKATLDICRDKAERLRKMIENTTVFYGETPINVACSFGAASIPENNVENVDRLIAKSDKALYKAKEMGRNRVITATD